MSQGSSNYKNFEHVMRYRFLMNTMMFVDSTSKWKNCYFRVKVFKIVDHADNRLATFDTATLNVDESISLYSQRFEIICIRVSAFISYFSPIKKCQMNYLEKFITSELTMGKLITASGDCSFY